MTLLCTLLIGGGLLLCGFLLGAAAAVRACAKCVQDPYSNIKVTQAMIRMGASPDVFFNREKWWNR